MFKKNKNYSLKREKPKSRKQKTGTDHNRSTQLNRDVFAHCLHLRADKVDFRANKFGLRTNRLDLFIKRDELLSHFRSQLSTKILDFATNLSKFAFDFRKFALSLFVIKRKIIFSGQTVCNNLRLQFSKSFGLFFRHTCANHLFYKSMGIKGNNSSHQKNSFQKNNALAANNISKAYKTFKLKFLFIPLLGLSLQGCETLENFSLGKKNTPLPQITQPAETSVIGQLEQASITATKALSQLSRIESTRTPIKAPKATGLVPDVLVKPVTISWVGPLEGIALELSKLAKYDFSIIGKKPASTVIVNLSSNDTTLIELFKDIGQQAGTRALVLVDAPRSKVEIIYEN